MIQPQSTDPGAFWLRDQLVEPSLHRITGENGPVPVEPRVMTVLVTLASRPGQVWTRRELIDTVWADTIVNEEVLTRAISHLRRHLADESSTPHFIETIRKGGYRLVCPVRLVREDNQGSSETGLRSPGERAHAAASPGDGPPEGRAGAEPGSGGPRAGAPPPVGFRPTIPVLVVLAGIVITGIFWIVLGPSSVDGTRTTPPTVTNVTSYLGEELYPSISPDGSMVAFVWRESPGVPFDLFVKHVAGEAPLRLTEDDATESFTAWSPEGAELAFARSDSSGHGIFIVPAIGGQPRLLARTRSRPWGLSWSPSGEEIAFSDRAGPQQPNQIRVVERSTGRIRSLTTPPPFTIGDRRPAFSPDGSRLAFVRYDALGAGEIWVVPVSGGQAESVTQEWDSVYGLAWDPGGENLIVSGFKDGALRLWRVNLSSGRSSWIPLPGVRLHDPTVAAGTGALVYVETRLEQNIWQIGVRPDGEEASDPHVLIGSTGSDSEPQFAPDGSLIAFISSREGTPELWISDVDGEELIRLTSFEGSVVGSPRWSPDGGSLAFFASTGEAVVVWEADVEGGKPRPVTEATGYSMPVCWSRDGMWIYTRSDRESGWQIWRVRSDGSEIQRITSGGGNNAWEDEEGLWLYFTRPGQRSLWRLPVGVTEMEVEPELVLEKFLFHPHAFWQGRDRDLLTVVHGQSTYDVVLVDPGTGATQAVAGIPTGSAPTLTLSPDGSRLLYSRIDRSESDLKRLEKLPWHGGETQGGSSPG